MTTPWNGLPDQPERSGGHWVASNCRPNGWFLRKWIADCQKWDGPFGTDTAFAAQRWVYGCRCPDPSELAQMRKDERERIKDDLLIKLSEVIPPMQFGSASGGVMKEIAMNTIRALTDDEGKKS